MPNILSLSGSSLLQADVYNVKDAISSAVDVMQAMASSICLLLSKVTFVLHWNPCPVFWLLYIYTCLRIWIKGRVGCYHEYKATFKTWLFWELQIKVMFVVSGGSR